MFKCFIGLELSMNRDEPSVPSAGDMFKADYSSLFWYKPFVEHLTKKFNPKDVNDGYLGSLIRHMTSYEVSILTQWAGYEEWLERGMNSMTHDDVGYVQEVIFDVMGNSFCCPKEFREGAGFIKKPFSEITEFSE